MLRRIGYIALAVYALSLWGAFLAVRPGAVAHGQTSRPPATSTSGPRELTLGFALNMHHTDNVGEYIKSVDEVADMGFNTVLLLTPAFQDDGTSQEIRIDVSPGHSPQRQDLVQVLNHARQRGLRTVLMPVVLLANPRGNEWRGKIQPESWDVWWKSYRKAMDYFLGIANEAQVDTLAVGSELLSTEKLTDRWEAMIDHARNQFKGRLIYSTNWDHYDVPSFWKKLDAIGISCYWDITVHAQANEPKPEELAQRWKEIRKEVMDFGRSQNKPVLLTELGYPSLSWGLKDPWNYIAADDTKATPQVQLAGYKAFLAAWNDLLVGKPQPDEFNGVIFYKWDVYAHGGEQDTGYGIRGKPTYQFLKQWLEQRRKL